MMHNKSVAKAAFRPLPGGADGDSPSSASAATKVPRGRTFHPHSQRRVGSDYGDEETALHTPDSIHIVLYRSVLLWRGDLSSHLLCVRK